MEESQQYQPPAQPDGTDRDEELTRLRERLTFYESFDQLIQDNVSRAGILLREAATRHQDSELAIRTTTAQFEQQQLAERVEYRKIFSALLDDVTTVQQNVEQLARQVADALDDLESVIPAAGETAALGSDRVPSIPPFRTTTTAELGAGTNAGDETPPDVAASDSVGEPLESMATDAALHASEDESDQNRRQSAQDQVVHQSFTAHPESRSAEPVDELFPEDDSGGEPQTPAAQPSASGPGSTAFSDIVQASVERVSQTIAGRDSDDIGEEQPDLSAEVIEPQGISVDLAPTAEEADDEETGPWSDSGEGAATTLLVHGVPRATTALSLKRYLEGLEQVHSVEPREYAEGVLRLQVSSERPVRVDDLQGWPEASALELLADSDDFVEVRLSP